MSADFALAFSTEAADDVPRLRTLLRRQVELLDAALVACRSSGDGAPHSATLTLVDSLAQSFELYKREVDALCESSPRSPLHSDALAETGARRHSTAAVAVCAARPPAARRVSRPFSLNIFPARQTPNQQQASRRRSIF